MADPRGFMIHSRNAPLYRSVTERVRDFKEVQTEPSSELAKVQALRCMDCGVPFCQGDSGCPLGNLIPEWNELAAEGRWKEALERLHATNNFPEFTSRLCPAPCETSCVLGLHSEAVSIKTIERRIIDSALDLGLIRPQHSIRQTGRVVAIIGSGPAGLTAAQELARMGHGVHVFEREAKVGGLLRYGIPDFKMEKHLIDRRVQQLQAEGVEFITSTSVGKDLSFATLRRDYDAVGFAIGAERPRDLQVPGRDLDGIHFAMDYLVEQNRAIGGEKDLPVAFNARGKRVIVIGGGDTGSDCVGTAHRQGAREVHQFELLAQPPLSRSESTPWPYWPMMLRTSHAHEEGGRREWSLSTKAFLGRQGRVTGLRAERVQMVDGRPQPLPNGDVEFEADLVILAMGFSGPRDGAFLSSLGLAQDERGHLKTTPNLMTSIEGVFAAGDVRRGASLIVWAIAEGRRMARGMDQYLSRPTFASVPCCSPSRDLS